MCNDYAATSKLTQYLIVTWPWRWTRTASKKLMNGNSFRLGVSGSGKSFSAKEEIVHLALSTDDDILILDPESEFTKLVEALGGQVVKVSATSDNHLNAMDMDAAYGNEKNPLIEKSEFILSVFEQLVGAGNLSAKEKSILDRCAADVYRDYIRSGYTGEVPTLKDMYRQLMLQPEEEARGLALSSELFINGSLNTFAQPTNVNKKNRIMDYDIRELGEKLMPLGMLVTLDSIFNRLIQNWKEGKTTAPRSQNGCRPLPVARCLGVRFRRCGFRIPKSRPRNTHKLQTNNLRK